MQFGTNVLGMRRVEPYRNQTSCPQRRVHLAGHFYLTKLLLPLLTATAKNSPRGSVRVVNLSSIGHHIVPPGGIQWSTLRPGDDYLAVGKKVGALKLYGQSKLVMKSVSQRQQQFFNILRCRATSSSRTSLLGNMVATASSSFPYILETSGQILGVI
jgi:NAD(P)-dependent dehydrogenase (short-subunit alcohol dehydrogenase family)